MQTCCSQERHLLINKKLFKPEIHPLKRERKERYVIGKYKNRKWVEMKWKKVSANVPKPFTNWSMRNLEFSCFEINLENIYLVEFVCSKRSCFDLLLLTSWRHWTWLQNLKGHNLLKYINVHLIEAWKIWEWLRPSLPLHNLLVAQDHFQTQARSLNASDTND